MYLKTIIALNYKTTFWGMKLVFSAKITRSVETEFKNTETKCLQSGPEW